MAKTVVGLFDSFDTADAVVRELQEAGAGSDHLSVVRSDADKMDYSSQGTTASGAAVGARSGSTGGLRSLISSAKSSMLRGVGSARIGGHLAQHASETNGLVGALTAHGVPSDEARFYAEGVRRGSTLIMARVHDDDADDVSDIMHRHGAVDIHGRSQTWKQSGWSDFDENAQPYTHEQITKEHETYRTSMAPTTGKAAATTTAREGEVVLPVIEEELAVGKRTVERGGARIYTHVTEKPVAETVRLRTERVRVERHPVNREIAPGSLDSMRDGSIEITERSEEAVIDKRARVVEEVVVSKEATEREQTVRDTVRSTDVRVEEVQGTGKVTDAGRTTTHTTKK